MGLIPWQATVQDDAGNAVPMPVVTVRDASDDSLATIYDIDGVATLNPISGLANGFVQFQVHPGRYKIEGAKDGSIAATWVWDAIDPDAGVPYSSFSDWQAASIPDDTYYSWYLNGSSIVFLVREDGGSEVQNNGAEWSELFVNGTSVEEYVDLSSLPASGLTNVIYVTLDDGKQYRWGGTQYVEISASLALGETNTTAYRGDHGKTAYDFATTPATNEEVINGTVTDKFVSPSADKAALDERVGNHSAPVDLASEWYLRGRKVVWSPVDADEHTSLAIFAGGEVAVGDDIHDSGARWYYMGYDIARANVDSGERPWMLTTTSGATIIPGLDTSFDGEVIAGVPIQCWGDSLTAGAGGGGVTYPSALASSLGVTVINNGIGSQTSTQISMRQGGTVCRVTVSGNQIAAGANTITAIDSVALSSSGGMAADNDHPFPLSAAANNATTTASVIIQGVPGTLTRTASGGPPSTTEEYTFTPTDETYLPVNCPEQSPVIFDNDGAQENITLIWVGRNNFIDPTSIKQHVANMIARLDSGKKRYLVLTVLTGDAFAERDGGVDYATITTLNADLEAAYPGRVVDVRRRIISEGLARASISPTSQDITDISDDTVPVSLRSDGIHLNAPGYTVIAEIIAEEITARGWV